MNLVLMAGTIQSCKSPSLAWARRLERDFLVRSNEDHILGRCDNRHRSIRSTILERPVLDIQNPSASEILRRRGGRISNRDYTLSSSKLFKVFGFLESGTDIATRSRPLKYYNGVEIIVGSVAAIDLELVRLNGDLIFPRWSHLIGFDKLDVGIRVIDPDRGRPSVFACLFNMQRRLVVFRICGLYHEDSGCRVKVTVICCDSKSTLV